MCDLPTTSIHDFVPSLLQNLYIYVPFYIKNLSKQHKLHNNSLFLYPNILIHPFKFVLLFFVANMKQIAVRRIEESSYYATTTQFTRKPNSPTPYKISL